MAWMYVNNPRGSCKILGARDIQGSSYLAGATRQDYRLGESVFAYGDAEATQGTTSQGFSSFVKKGKLSDG